MGLVEVILRVSLEVILHHLLRQLGSHSPGEGGRQRLCQELSESGRGCQRPCQELSESGRGAVRGCVRSCLSRTCLYDTNWR